jgi:hypothetical protein
MRGIGHENFVSVVVGVLPGKIAGLQSTPHPIKGVVFTDARGSLDNDPGGRGFRRGGCYLPGSGRRIRNRATPTPAATSAANGKIVTPRWATPRGATGIATTTRIDADLNREIPLDRRRCREGVPSAAMVSVSPSRMDFHPK